MKRALLPPTEEFVRGGGILPTAQPSRANKWSRGIGMILGGVGLAGLTYAATHTRQEMDEVRAKVGTIISIPFQYLDKNHRDFMNETYGVGHYPESDKTSSRTEVDALMKKNAATEEAIRRENPLKCATREIHQQVLMYNMTHKEHISEEEENRLIQTTLNNWIKKWDEAGVPHN